jgi:hypothetical protein
MEGLYYESSATTPFHFINQSELSLAPSDPMVGLPYASQPDVALGVQHLQMLGVKYYMALNSQLQQQAAADPSLKLISTFGPFTVTGYSASPTTQTQYWKLYLVQNSPRVHPLAYQPVVMQGLNNSSQPKYLQVMTQWYDDPAAWPVYLAANGPSSWARVPYGTTQVGNVPTAPRVPEPTTQVSDIVEHNASISFNVTRLHVPVVVTISYFPNWQVSGAQGVYRVSPNLMVVIPTSHHVQLYYGTTPVDYEGWVLTLLALAGLVLLIRRPQAAMAQVGRPRLGRWQQQPKLLNRPALAAVYSRLARWRPTQISGWPHKPATPAQDQPPAPPPSATAAQTESGAAAEVPVPGDNGSAVENGHTADQ